MTPLDFLAYQEDMEDIADIDYTLWIWTQECEYWYLMLVLLIAECPHMLAHITHEDDSDWIF